MYEDQVDSSGFLPPPLSKQGKRLCCGHCATSQVCLKVFEYDIQASWSSCDDYKYVFWIIYTYI